MSGVAILGQSSNILLNITMLRRGLPVAYVIAAGNQAQVGLADMAAAVMEDERVTAVGLHVEGDRRRPGLGGDGGAGARAWASRSWR